VPAGIENPKSLTCSDKCFYDEAVKRENY